MAAAINDGESSLHTLALTPPPSYLTPCPNLSRHARLASRHLYSSLFPTCPNPKPPLNELIIDDAFDAEQIWCQIDLLSRPLLSLLKKEIKKIERDPPVIGGLDSKKDEIEKDKEEEESEKENEEIDDEEEGEEDEEEEGEEENEKEEDNEIEDEFFKVRELEEFLVKDEEREFGSGGGGGKKGEEDDDDEVDDENTFDLLYGGLDDDSNEDHAENARYDDFWGGKKKRGGDIKDNYRKGKSYLKQVESNDEPDEQSLGGDLEDQGLDDEQSDDSDADTQNQGNMTLSRHEKERLKIQSEIEKREKANLDPKAWTMQGEVTAAKRPKNSALEVDLDFEHNMKPPPVVTEEFTASLEDLIKQRIIEGRFDDVQKAPALPSKAPKELKELDENKSKKGLAELYEEEFAQQTGLASAPLTSADVEKKEATMLFKRLCLKLDALSHFHFAPKPVIEDMSIQSNVPALAMEEIAPVAVSDAAMLAPEEIFKGKGDVKEETELTQAERKRRRANKKRKFKAEKAKKEANKARQNAAYTQLNDTGMEES